MSKNTVVSSIKTKKQTGVKVSINDLDENDKKQTSKKVLVKDHDEKKNRYKTCHY